MTKDPVQYVPAVPRWFTYALHWWNKRRRCNRQGHTVTRYRVPVHFWTSTDLRWWNVCDYCGEVLP